MVELTTDVLETLIVPVSSSTFKGYCVSCGTWDDHGFACSCCGYAFAGDPEADNDVE